MYARLADISTDVLIDNDVGIPKKEHLWKTNNSTDRKSLSSPGKLTPHEISLL
jgi:hypothetical protein